MTNRKNIKIINHTRQISKFTLVGIGNTLLDFAILNILVQTGMGLLQANIISVSVAMVVSFELNRRFVFVSQSQARLRQAGLFLLITGFGLFIIQSAIIYFLSSVWLLPLDIATHALSFLDGEFVRTNVAKVVATLASMVWNYILYHKVVFSSEE